MSIQIECTTGVGKMAYVVNWSRTVVMYVFLSFNFDVLFYSMSFRFRLL